MFQPLLADKYPDIEYIQNPTNGWDWKDHQQDVRAALYALFKATLMSSATSSCAMYDELTTARSHVSWTDLFLYIRRCIFIFIFIHGLHIGKLVTNELLNCLFTKVVSA